MHKRVPAGSGTRFPSLSRLFRTAGNTDCILENKSADRPADIKRGRVAGADRCEPVGAAATGGVLAANAGRAAVASDAGGVTWKRNLVEPATTGAERG